MEGREQEKQEEAKTYAVLNCREVSLSSVVKPASLATPRLILSRKESRKSNLSGHIESAKTNVSNLTLRRSRLKEGCMSYATHVKKGMRLRSIFHRRARSIARASADSSKEASRTASSSS